MLYLLIILGMMIVISSLNIIFNPMYPFYVYIIATVLFVLLSILLDGIVALIIRMMPEKYFDYHKKIFSINEKELRFYNKICIKKWKEKVPELGFFTHFRKNKIKEPKNNDYVSRYILEACYGIIIHIVSSPVAFLIILFDFKMYSGNSNLYLTIALPVAIVNSILILLPAFILKYNLKKLIKLYNINLKKESNELRII